MIGEEQAGMRALQPSYTLCDGYEAAELATAAMGDREGYPTLAGHSVNEFIKKIRIKPRNPRARMNVGRHLALHACRPSQSYVYMRHSYLRALDYVYRSTSTDRHHNHT